MLGKGANATVFSAKDEKNKTWAYKTQVGDNFS